MKEEVYVSETGGRITLYDEHGGRGCPICCVQRMEPNTPHIELRDRNQNSINIHLSCIDDLLSAVSSFSPENHDESWEVTGSLGYEPNRLYNRHRPCLECGQDAGNAEAFFLDEPAGTAEPVAVHVACWPAVRTAISENVWSAAAEHALGDLL